ncbi:response regulator [Thalassotalea marina]|uniref:histidine kinase n=1 Tax=Thalassotalea marina TaxID=1673741 RepID=A0A919EN85_9GAMM|nr:response regulator [Thalassotalea marina]GHF98424.1 histidine kinase [Thalassotalea marina]
MVNINSIGSRISLGIFTIVLILCTIVGINATQHASINQFSKQSFEEDVPGTQISLNLKFQLARALNALSGWSVNGAEQYKRDFNLAWDEITFYKNELSSIAKFSDSQHKKSIEFQVSLLQEVLNRLHKAQQDVLEVAQSSKNFPGIRLLNLEIAPAVDRINDLASQLINVESKKAQAQQNTSRLKLMADFRASFANATSSLRIYLLSSNEQYRIDHQSQWKENTIHFNRLLDSSDILPVEQQQILAEIKVHRDLYEPMIDKLIELRAANNWNIAQHLLNGVVAPLDNEAKNLIDDIYLKNDKHMKDNMTNIADSQKFAYQVSIASLLFAIILAAILAYFLTRMITNPIKEVLNVATNISRGNFNQSTTPKGAIEIKQMFEALSSMIRMLRKVEEHAKSVSQGDYSHPFTPISTEDQLGFAIQKMSKNLATTTLQNEKQNWANKGIADFNSHIQGQINLDDMLSSISNFIGDYFDVSVVALFLAQGNTLKLTSSYALKYRSTTVTEYSIGQGLVGQSALEKKTLIFRDSDTDQDWLNVDTGVSIAHAQHIAVVPMVNKQSNENTLVGVIVVSNMDRFNETEIQTLENIAQSAAVAIEMVESRSQLQDLLEESQVQAEELQAQQDELKTANEELEHQTNTLTKAKADLEEQSKKLEESNYELTLQSKMLEDQKHRLEIKNTEVEQAKQLVEQKAEEVAQASKYKSEFLANMSHELRTPLNSLLILSENLKENETNNLTQEQVEDIDIIHSGGTKLLNLINDILDLAKVESGKLSVNYETLPLESFINEINKEFHPLAQRKQLKFKISIAENLPKVIESDIMRLSQIIRNLLSNAIKFTNEGEISLKVSQSNKQNIIERLANDNTHHPKQALLFEVKDSGIGIDKSVHKAIFEAFQQADGSTSRVFGGTGLGLTISRELANLLGGYISIKSKPDHGSTFTLTLPLRNLEEKAVANDHLSASQALAKEIEQPIIADDRYNVSSNEQPIVLIIEHNAQTAKAILSIAHNHNFLGIVASSGKSGLALVNQYQISAIILNLDLPDIHGAKVLEGLKTSPLTQNIPVHLINERHEFIEKVDGAEGFITKPLDTDNISEIFNHEHNANARILIIENDQNNCHALKKLFNKKQFQLETTGSGLEAIELLKEISFDCIVLDLTLDDMTGIQWLEQCHNKEFTLPPIVIYTAEELSEEKYKQLLTYTQSIVIKGQRSAERLLDEVILFLTTNLAKANIDVPSQSKQENPFLDKKILLVDDDMRNTYALSKILKAKGMKIVIADDGQMAVDQVAQQQDIDLILMDIMMPVMDGYQAIKKIRENNQHPYPIIALTAKAMAEDRERCLNAGANDYLTKPVQTQKLLEMVKLWLYQ